MSGTRTHQERIDNSEHMDIDSGDESDGKSALRQVEAREEPKAAQRGPGNASMQHFHDPTATAQEVLLNPLVWWKVSTLFTMSVS